MAFVRTLVSKLTNVGVDPAQSRQVAKHIVLTNVLASIFAIFAALASIGPDAHNLLPLVRGCIGFGVAIAPIVFALNARRRHLAASAFLVGAIEVIFIVIGRSEPEATEHWLFVTNGAVLAWFVFPATHRRWAVAATVVAIVASLWFTHEVHAHPPPQLPGFDAYRIGVGNRMLFFVLLFSIVIYAARQVTLTERELVAERQRSEALLKSELSHQVAARSRELGQMLQRVEASFVVGRLTPGDRFDERYVVKRALGAGAMGVVYEVRRTTDDQRLALKLVTGEVSGPNAARFAREAEIGARVRHPNVVSIVDVGISSGAPFLAMEMADGGSLEEQRARFGDAAWARPILAEIAAGVAALHEAGVVHRDLKPGNVLFTVGEGGARTSKISDFGISRFGALDTSEVDPAGATVNAATVRPNALTATGALLGTPFYMAPESARGGRTVDAPADVFAFGIIACEMLTGRAPFALPAVFAAMAGEPLPAPTMDDIRDERLRATLAACLAERPAARPTMRAVAAVLGTNRSMGNRTFPEAG